ncbi:MAG: VPLPA-CTERM sorting domain-containing protein [Pseudomonadota bacterium]
MKLLNFKAGALALALFATVPASAAVVGINFDNVPTGATATSAAPSGIAFYQAHYVNDLDAFGDEIPNTQKFQIDAENNALYPVTVGNPTVNGYGAAPSGSNALNALDQAVLMRFDTAQNLDSFSVTLDNSTFGNLSQSALYFLDASKTIIGQIDFDQTVMGLIVNLNTPLTGVQEILLSSGAFYDDISFSNTTVAPVPLPAAFPLLISALTMLGVFGRRRKS